MLLALLSGVAVLLIPVVLLVELCALAALGELLMSLEELAEFGEVLLLGLLLFGVVVLSGVVVEGVVEGGCVEVLEPALPEMLPAVFWSELVLPEFELEAEPVMLPEFEEPLALATVMSSFTFFTPATDLARRFASFLSSLLATVPESFTLPFSTSTWTFCRLGLPASCS